MIASRGSIKIAFGIVYLLAMGVGCATVPMTDTSADANAKQFQTGPVWQTSTFAAERDWPPNSLRIHTSTDR